MKELPSRKPLRAPSWDYAQTASYMVTICVQDRFPVLGRIRNDLMLHSDAGHAIEAIWNDIPARFGTTSLDAYVIMPNHLHGILHLHHDLGEIGPCSLGDVLKWFKGQAQDGTRWA